MLLLTSAPINFTSTKVLHIVHPRMDKNGTVQVCISQLGKALYQLVHPGEHHLTQARFDEFDTIYLHTVYKEYVHDYVRRLQRDDWIERLRAVAKSGTKTLIVCDAAVQILSKNAIVIPRDNANIFFNHAAKSVNVDIDGPGLNLITNPVLTQYDPNNSNPAYQRVIRQLSTTKTVYLLTPQAVFDTRGRCNFGDMYVAKHNEITKITKYPALITEQQQETETERKVAPPRALYEEDFKKEDTAAVVNSKIDIVPAKNKE